MLNIEYFIKSLKVTWFKRLLQTDNSPWVQIFENTISMRKNLFEFGAIKTEKLIESCQNNFWKDALKAWLHFCSLNSPHTYQDCLTCPLWFNRNISGHELYIPNWSINNINIVNDVLERDGSVKTLQKIIEHYNVDSIDFLTYHRLKSSVIKYKEKYKKKYYTSTLYTATHNSVPATSFY